MIIKLKVEGTVYEWDTERLLVAEARELKLHTGFTPPRWLAAVDESDPDALAGLIYLAKKRAGETLRFSDLDGLDYADFDLEAVDPDAEEPDGEQAPDGDGQAVEPPDPTPASGESGPTTPTPDTGATSPPSPTSSSTGPETSAS
ncbi:hypothetical protein ACF1BS_04125 [Streptomyces sp. NPDC014748]|uniref:hypothetical protein n=1 Tax=Streptomyces sp. NPDC014748 TaxID=3364905 RepID=UPI0036F4B815